MTRGDSLLQSAHYELAGKAFQAAGDAVRAAHARSCWLYEMARALPDDSASAQKRQNLFREVRSQNSMQVNPRETWADRAHSRIDLASRVLESPGNCSAIAKKLKLSLQKLC